MIEKVNPSHPDKVADRIAGAIVDLAYTKNDDCRMAVEVLIGHGVCNALRHILMQNPDVEYAVYNIDHPLTGKPEMTIKTKKGKRPRNALKKAAEELHSQSADLKKLIDEALE